MGLSISIISMYRPWVRTIERSNMDNENRMLPKSRVTFNVVLVTMVEPFFSSSCREWDRCVADFVRSSSESLDEFVGERVFFSYNTRTVNLARGHRTMNGHTWNGLPLRPVPDSSASIEFVSLYCDGDEETVVRVWSRSNGCSRSVYKYRSNRSISAFWLNDTDDAKSDAIDDVSRRNRNSYGEETMFTSHWTSPGWSYVQLSDVKGRFHRTPLPRFILQKHFQFF